MSGSDRQHAAAETLGLVALALGALCSVVVFLPPEGRVAGPIHDWLSFALGRAAFELPLALFVVATLLLARSLRPWLRLPWSRLAGLVIVGVAVVPAQHLLGVGTGVVGLWSSEALLDALGGPATGVVLVAAILGGTLLVFHIRLAQLGPAAGRLRRLAPRRTARLAHADPEPVAHTALPEPVGAPAPRVEAVEAVDAWRLPGVEQHFTARGDQPVSGVELAARGRVIEDTLASFNVGAHVVEVHQGPAVTQFGIQPADGVAVSKILSRQNDLALRLSASSVRLEAPVPGKSLVGLEVPNTAIAAVGLRDVLDTAEWKAASGVRLALGRDVAGKAVVADLERMPHLLIAGATGAGKSVCLNSIVASLLCQYTPDELQLVMIDPKRVELAGFADVPHLRLPVIADMEQVVGALKWVVVEMERRYTLFAEHGARNLAAYNRGSVAPLPRLVVLIDELADMMMTAADEVERALCRLAQLARATGIHLVVATQRPSVDVLTGLIKANFPTRLAFAVASQTDSRVVLDQAGAEKLLGRGDALFVPPEAMKPVRLQGAYVSDDEMEALVAHWSAQGRPRYSQADVDQVTALAQSADDETDDELVERAHELADTVGRVSVSLLQRRLGIGKARAAKLVDRLEREGYAEG